MKCSLKLSSLILFIITSIYTVPVKSTIDEFNNDTLKKILYCRQKVTTNEKLICLKKYLLKTLNLDSQIKVNIIENRASGNRNESCFIRVDGELLADSILNFTNNSEVQNFDEARHRRQRQNMMMTMLFGVTALGAVLVPMGFQLLSVISGKALLLAKMALLLASINGLKRVANTGLHYGLYHVPSEVGNYYDRSGAYYPGGLPKSSDV